MQFTLCLSTLQNPISTIKFIWFIKFYGINSCSSLSLTTASYCLFRFSFAKLNCTAMFFLETRGCVLKLFLTRNTWISLCLIVLLSNNMLTEACRVWGVMSFLELLTRSACSNLWGEFLLLWGLWKCLNTHPIAPERQTDKASAFIEVMINEVD